MRNIYGWIICLFLVACQSGSSSDQDDADIPSASSEDDYEEKVDTVFSIENIQFFQSLGFTGKAIEEIPGFDWSKFVMTDAWKEDTMYTSVFQPDSAYYENYGRFLKYSPDSSYFIDLDSYNIHISKDSKGNWIGEELGPDTEVSLINPSTKEKTRLIFLGPGSSVEDAQWLDDENIVLMGVQEEGMGNSVAVVWRYHLPTQTFYLYELKDAGSAQALIGAWRSERLKGIHLK